MIIIIFLVIKLDIQVLVNSKDLQTITRFCDDSYGGKKYTNNIFR